MCVASCMRQKNYCKQQSNQTYDLCLIKERQKALFDFEKYKSEHPELYNRSSSSFGAKTVKDFDRSFFNCSETYQQCEQSYQACFKSCGG